MERETVLDPPHLNSKDSGKWDLSCDRSIRARGRLTNHINNSPVLLLCCYLPLVSGPPPCLIALCDRNLDEMVDATGLEPVANILEALVKTATSKSGK
jgi:hypothetical protein